MKNLSSINGRLLSMLAWMAFILQVMAFGVNAEDQVVLDETSKELKCNNAKHIYDLSQICFKSSRSIKHECLINFGTSITVLRKFGGVVFCLVCLFGIIGNTATLLSIPYSTIKKLHGFDKNFKSTTIFILNLSLVELVILCFGMLPSVYVFLVPHSPLGSYLCQIYPLILRNNFTLESLVIATISIGRCVNILKPHIWRNFTNRNRNIALLLLAPWLLSVLSNIPALLQASEIGIGWNCSVGWCTQIKKCPLDECPSENKQWNFVIWYNFTLALSSVTSTVISYILIHNKAKCSSLELNRFGSVNDVLHKREMKMTKTILLLVMSHCIFNLPVMIIDTVIYYLFGDYIIWSDSCKFVIDIFWLLFHLQFIFNIIIYAASNNEFQSAYIDFSKFMFCQKST